MYPDTYELNYLLYLFRYIPVVIFLFLPRLHTFLGLFNIIENVKWYFRFSFLEKCTKTYNFEFFEIFILENIRIVLYKYTSQIAMIFNISYKLEKCLKYKS